jgi:hypothetical protein
MANPESGIRFNEVSSSPEYGFLRYTDLRDAEKLIDVTQWDGSDFFMVWPLPRFVFYNSAGGACNPRARFEGRPYQGSAGPGSDVRRFQSGTIVRFHAR